MDMHEETDKLFTSECVCMYYLN